MMLMSYTFTVHINQAKLFMIREDTLANSSTPNYPSFWLSDIAGDAADDVRSVAVCLCSHLLLTPVPELAREVTRTGLVSPEI
jgi:hypothetical protein